MTTRSAKGTVNIQVQVPVSMLRQVLTTAVEAGHTHGIGYWANEEGNNVSNDRDHDGNVSKLTFTLREPHAIRKAGGDPKAQTLTAVIDETDIASALGIALSVSDKGEYANKELAHCAAQWLAGNGDGPSADVLVQVAVFGEVVYG